MDSYHSQSQQHLPRLSAPAAQKLPDPAFFSELLNLDNSSDVPISWRDGHNPLLLRACVCELIAGIPQIPNLAWTFAAEMGQDDLGKAACQIVNALESWQPRLKRVGSFQQMTTVGTHPTVTSYADATQNPIAVHKGDHNEKTC